MYLLAHAMAGILIGLVLVPLTGDRRVVALAALGAVLPDLIDKPLGHIILAGTVNYGRLYFHGLTVLSLFVIAGLLLYRYRHRIGLLVVAAGMASHQVLDGMWYNPVAWFWPFLGPIPGHHYPENYFWEAILRRALPTERVDLSLRDRRAVYHPLPPGARRPSPTGSQTLPSAGLPWWCSFSLPSSPSPQVGGS